MRRAFVAHACLPVREGPHHHTTGPRHACAPGSGRDFNSPAPRHVCLANLSGVGDGDSPLNRIVREHSTYRTNALSDRRSAASAAAIESEAVERV